MKLSQERRDRLLHKLIDAKGFASVDEFLTSSGFLDAVSPAICTDCELVCEMEPDQARGYCEACGGNTVVAALILAEII
jgi:hypothetical protein